jgi:Rho GTPase-activating protein 21/23
VPLLVAKCTKIVETKGMNIVGIYRIPGNTAAISNLNELINRNGMDEQTLSDPKWEDVNVVSSLLKLFIRSLPDPILPNELYGNFIEADKKSDFYERFQELKGLLGKLPQHNYETLKHLIAHLNRVSENALVNLMEPRNLGKFNFLL